MYNIKMDFKDERDNYPLVHHKMWEIS